jgi:DNA-binding protein HU-beta
MRKMLAWSHKSCVESPSGAAPEWISHYCARHESPERMPKMATQMTKSQLIEKIATENELAKKDVKGVLEALASVGHKELKKNGVFLVPGLAKFIVIKKPATKARQGINPFTKEPTMFKAKPARKIVRARPVKATKDAV